MAERVAARHRAAILNDLRGRIPATAPSLGHRAGVLATAAVITLLPLAYLAVIAFAVYLTLIAILLPLFYREAGGDLFGMITVSLVLVTVCGAVIFFLIAPLSSRPRRREPMVLERARAPLFFAVLERLGRILDAPVPSVVELDDDVRIFARRRPGRRELTLHLGTSLVAGLTVAQLAGILAHELGRFRPRAGGRASLWVRGVGDWLWRRAYEPSAVDDGLARRMESGRHGWAVFLTLGLCRVVIRLTRGLLAGLAWIGRVIGGPAARRLELDADRYQVRLVGFPVFASTIEELRLLERAYERTLADLEGHWDEWRLPDSLPRLTLAHRRALGRDEVEEVRRLIASRRTGLLATHPSDRRRLAEARRVTRPPLFHSALDAGVLFEDFDELARRVTEARYAFELGEAVRPERLITT